MDEIVQQYLAPVLKWLGALFTQGEWKALVLAIVLTLAATHIVKVAWRLSSLRGGSGLHVHAASLVIGFSSCFWIWPPGSVPWWAAGIIAGPASNVTFKLVYALLKKFAPDIAAGMNFDRRKDDNPIPPAGTPDRRKQP